MQTVTPYSGKPTDENPFGKECVFDIGKPVVLVQSLFKQFLAVPVTRVITKHGLSIPMVVACKANAFLDPWIFLTGDDINYCGYLFQTLCESYSELHNESIDELFDTFMHCILFMKDIFGTNSPNVAARVFSKIAGFADDRNCIFGFNITEKNDFDLLSPTGKKYNLLERFCYP
jgi:hypothetical protein